MLVPRPCTSGPPTEHHESNGENAPKGAVRDSDDRLRGSIALLEPLGSGIGALDVLMIGSSKQSIAPLQVTEQIPDTDRKLERNPGRRLEPDLTKEWRRHDISAPRDALRGRDGAGQIAGADQLRARRDACERVRRRAVGQDTSGVVCVLVAGYGSPAEPTPVMDMSRGTMANEQDPHDESAAWCRRYPSPAPRNAAPDLFQQPWRIRVDDFHLDGAHERGADDANARGVRGGGARDLAPDLGASHHGVDFALHAHVGWDDDLDARHDAADLDLRRAGSKERLREVDLGVAPEGDDAEQTRQDPIAVTAQMRKHRDGAAPVGNEIGRDRRMLGPSNSGGKRRW